MIFAEGFTWWTVAGPVSGASVSGIVALIIWWLNKKIPNKIQIWEISSVSLLRIASTIRPRIAATLDGKPVNALSQGEYAITNMGADTIKDIVLTLCLPTDTKILESELSGVNAQAIIDSSNKLRVSIPFLNPHRHHREVLTAKVVCDGTLKGMTVEGRGEGWSSIQGSLVSTLITRFTVAMIMPLISMAACIGVVFLTPWWRSVYEVPANSFSVPVFLWQLGFYTVAFVPLSSYWFWVYRTVIKRLRELQKK